VVINIKSLLLFLNKKSRITAAGTATDFNSIPLHQFAAIKLFIFNVGFEII